MVDWKIILGYSSVVLGAAVGILCYLISRESRKSGGSHQVEAIATVIVKYGMIGMTFVFGSGLGGFVGGFLLTSSVTKGFLIMKVVALGILIFLVLDLKVFTPLFESKAIRDREREKCKICHEFKGHMNGYCSVCYKRRKN